MKKEDAISILSIDADTDNLKKAYRLACRKYHPDKGGSDYMMQLVNAAYNFLKSIGFNAEEYTDFTEGDTDYGDDLNRAINAIKDLPGIMIEICGAWLWVTGDTKHHKDALGKNGAGFFYASKKVAWYYRPDNWKSSSRGGMSLDEIRVTHKSVTVKTKKQAQIK